MEDSSKINFVFYFKWWESDYGCIFLIVREGIEVRKKLVD